jgi:hypothetical protein
MWYLTDRLTFFLDFNIQEYFFGDEINEPKWYCSCKYAFIGQKIIIVLFIIGMFITFFIDILLIPFYLLYRVLGHKKKYQRQIQESEPKESAVTVGLPDIHDISDII